VRADLADGRAAEAAVAELAEQTGRIDGVFTAAGIDSCGALDTVSAQEWEQVVKVNLLGTAAVIRAALPHLERTNGTVVTCASTLGIKAVGDATAYCAAKFGVVGFTRALAAETAGRIGVTLLIPGGMHTAFFDGRDEQYKPPPDAKLNRPEDVAQTVLFALRQPPGCQVRELVVCSSEEASWP
jgi:NADP-dependent 3-hydroxy acid dehydrogenase YdfG